MATSSSEPAIQAPFGRVVRATMGAAALILGRGRELGTIEPGKLADVIVVRGNPLFDIHVLGYVERVVKGGVVYR